MPSRVLKSKAKPKVSKTAAKAAAAATRSGAVDVADSPSSDDAQVEEDNSDGAQLEEEEEAKEEEKQERANTFEEKIQVHGGCHCGSIKYRITIPRPTEAAPFKVNRCNCSFCQKLGMTNHYLDDPAANWTLLSPADKSALATYPPQAKNGSKYFCCDCGCHVFQEARYPMGDQMVDLFTVNATTIDQPQNGLDLSKAKVEYVDMLHDNIMAGKKDVPWPGGLP